MLKINTNTVYCSTCVSQTFFLRKRQDTRTGPGEGNLAHFSKSISAVQCSADHSRAGDVISNPKLPHIRHSLLCSMSRCGCPSGSAREVSMARFDGVAHLHTCSRWPWLCKMQVVASGLRDFRFPVQAMQPFRSWPIDVTPNVKPCLVLSNI